jgi:diguanylate cyclase (GGDEF)-like protein
MDGITDLYNDSFFRSRLDYSLARLKQLNLSHFTVLLMDLAQFEDIESRMGTQGSRSLLRDVARLLKGTLRPTDTIAHLDGARFAILVEDVGHWDIPILLANRILEKLGRYLNEKTIQSYVNIGIILCHVGYVDVDSILQDAYSSLSLAKADGKPGYKFYAQDNLNNTYDLEEIADMISLVGSEQLRGQAPMRKKSIRVRQIASPQKTIQIMGAMG